jgi:hypothetical protein
MPIKSKKINPAREKADYTTEHEWDVTLKIQTRKEILTKICLAY